MRPPRARDPRSTHQSPAASNLSIELGEQVAKVEWLADHREPLAAGKTWPLLARAIAIELEAIAVGIVEVESLADAVVRGTAEHDAGVGETPQRIGERTAVWIANRNVKETCAARRWGWCVLRVPSVEADVMVVATSRDEGGLIANPLLQLEAQGVAVERERPIQIGYLQVNVADVDAGIDWVAPWVHVSLPVGRPYSERSRRAASAASSALRLARRMVTSDLNRARDGALRAIHRAILSPR